MASATADLTVRFLRPRHPAVPKQTLEQAWTSAAWAVMDFETTGLNPQVDSIISVGLVPIDHSSADVGASYYTLVRPESPLSPASIEVHGLRPADLLEAPGCDAVAQALADAVGDRLLVAHAAWVETGFLRALQEHTGIALPRPVVDTAGLCRRAGVAAATASHEPSLELAARRLGLPVYSPHHALGDALTTAVVFMALAHRLSARHPGRPATVAEVLRASAWASRPFHHDRVPIGRERAATGE